MSRAYLRLDPAFYERKLDQGYTLPQIAAFVGCLCLAEQQVNRGRFRNVVVLKALLGPGGRQVTTLVERGDLIVDQRGRVYIDGWDEWQEGDVTVPERMRRLRTRKSVTGDTVTTVTNGTPPNVTPRLAEGGAVQSIGGATRPDNVYEAFRLLTGNKPDDKERGWLDDLCHDLHRGPVLDAMYADPEPTRRGFLGRVSRQLRGGAA